MTETLSAEERSSQRADCRARQLHRAAALLAPPTNILLGVDEGLARELDSFRQRLIERAQLEAVR